MKKQDIAMVVLLSILLVLWTMFGSKLTGGHAPASAALSTNAIAGSHAVAALAKATAITAPVAPVSDSDANAAAVAAGPVVPAKPEQTLTLTNAELEIVVSSKGAAISAVKLKRYHETVDPKSGPVALNFAERRALAPLQLAGVPTEADFDLLPTADGRGAQLEYRAPNGLVFRRVITLPPGKSYLLDVSDTLVNTAKQTLALPAHGLQLGAMRDLPGETKQSGYVYLGVDVLSGGGGAVQHLAGDISGQFDRQKIQIPDQFDQQKTNSVLPLTSEGLSSKASTVDWLAVKNKYFAQILLPNDTTESLRLYARRAPLSGETPANLYAGKMTSLEEVSAAVMFPEAHIETDRPLIRNMQFYIGPKLYSALAPLKRNVVDVMEFGFWGPVGKVLLWTMNAIAGVWPYNYGLAIMLLTILIRIIFWPLTHKGTQSMKRMQAVQPLMKEIREKFKDNAQKQQQEMMKLYKEHKINPLGGCLPMVIQIPVFIALFVVLRSAIELRFAHFLWIKDLSEAENLFPFGFAIPLLGWSAINILPILMSVTMAWQQKLTPSTGDPQQQKIMMIMPVMMLFFFYNFASGLSLYWTTNQILMIVQLYWQRRHPTALAKA